MSSYTLDAGHLAALFFLFAKARSKIHVLLCFSAFLFLSEEDSDSLAAIATYLISILVCASDGRPVSSQSAAIPSPFGSKVMSSNRPGSNLAWYVGRTPPRELPGNCLFAVVYPL
jgi:hypothetical protein